MDIVEKLQSKKFDHENRAKKRLVEELRNPTIKKVFAGGGFGKEHRIVVFGQSSVGKTTLILKLLGAKSQEEDSNHNILELGKYIRGNNREGGAGTATVYRYRISEDHSGKITFPDDETKSFDHLEQLQEFLLEIRNKVEAGEWKHTKPISITLPSQFFNGNENDIPWVITDIPGIESNVKAEYSHVEDLIKAYVLNCNILLVVEQSSQISQLNYLKIPGFGPWHYFGANCRLIVTRSLTEHTAKEAFKQKGKLNTSQLIEYYEKLLFQDGIDIEGIGGVYPMDYGDSWGKLMENESELFSYVKKAKLGVEQVLREDLSESMKAENIFKSIVQKGELEKRFNEKIEKIENRIKDLESERKNIEYKIAERNDKIEVYLKRKSEREGNLKKIEAKIESFHFNNPWSGYYPNDEAYDKSHPKYHDEFWNEKRESFRESIKRYSRKVFEDREKIDSLLSKNYEHNYPPFFVSWRDFVSYWKGWDVAYNAKWYESINPFNGKSKKKGRRARLSHREAVRDGLKQLYGFWTSAINDVVNKELNRRIKDEEKHIKTCKGAIEIFKGEKKKLNHNLDRIAKAISEEKERLQRVKESKSQDLKVFSELYPKFREEELNKSIHDMIEKASDAHAEEAFQYMAFAHQINEISKTISR